MHNHLNYTSTNSGTKDANRTACHTPYLDLDAAREGVRPDHDLLLARVEHVVGHVVVWILGRGERLPHGQLELHHSRLPKQAIGRLEMGGRGGARAKGPKGGIEEAAERTREEVKELRSTIPAPPRLLLRNLATVKGVQIRGSV